MEDERKSYHRDKRLTVTARSIMTWILGEPSEVINPEAIAQENGLTVKYVRTLLASLARCGYLNAPKQYRAKGGFFAWTPYTLKPQPSTAAMDKPYTSPVSMEEAPQPSTVSMVSTPQITTGGMVDSANQAQTPSPSTAAMEAHAPAHEEVFINLNASGSAKEKDKKPLSPPMAGDSQAIPKKAIRPPREPNPLFDAIAQHIFGFALENRAGISAAAPRIGKMLKDFPAEKETLTGERIAQFARWWNANKRTQDGKSLSKPLTAEKLATHWSDFEKAQPVKPVTPPQPALTEADKDAARREFNFDVPVFKPIGVSS